MENLLMDLSRESQTSTDTSEVEESFNRLFRYPVVWKIILAVSTFHSVCMRSKLSWNIREYVDFKMLKRSESTEQQCSKTTL